MRARITLKLGGEKRLMKFTLSVLKRYDSEMGEDGAALTLMAANPMTALLTISQYALDFPRNENKLPEEFDEEMLSDWIDDLPNNDLTKLMDTYLLSVKKFTDALGIEVPNEPIPALTRTSEKKK